MDTLRELSEKINIRGKIVANEPLSGHTTFGIGGQADVYAVPEDADSLKRILAYARENGVPAFILGGGANLLVSDAGIRGIVVDMKAFDSVRIDRSEGGVVMYAGAGLAITDAAVRAAEAGYSGLENFYSMPGSVGGALYMNARCYGRSVSDVLESVVTLNADGEISERRIDPTEFAYKESPFQKHRDVILGASFRLEPAAAETLLGLMAGYKRDREAKGHFLLPSAGSVFKNNRNFGEPTGILIDRLGLKGFGIGGARVSELHGNIIVNAGNARASDVLGLMEYLERRVKETYGYELEREIICAGDWAGAGQIPGASSGSSETSS